MATRSVLGSFFFFFFPVCLVAAHSAAAVGAVHSVRARERGSLTRPLSFLIHTQTHTHPQAAVAVREAGRSRDGASPVLLLPPWRRFFALIPFGPREGAEPKRAYFSKVFVRGTLSFEDSPSL